MTERTCSVDECERAHYARSYCAAHYKRLLEHGDVRAHIPLRPLPAADERDDIVTRILAQCITTERGCIEWQGFAIPSGYGTISWCSVSWVVHRAMWTVQVGPIPTDDDWTLDHLCFNRRCVNVKHLEVVTRIENSRRGGGLPRAHAANEIRNRERRAAPCCSNAHPWTPESTAYDRGRRYCRECKRESWARRSERVAAKRRARYAELRAAGYSVEEARRSLP